MVMTRTQVRKLAEEAKTLAEWMVVRDFAVQCYGEKATKVEIETYGEYDDEGGTDYRINGLTVSDKDGNDLEPDLTLPFYQTAEWQHMKTDYSYDEDGDYLNMHREIWFKGKHPWTLFEELPAEDATYDLTTVPTLSVQEAQ